MRRLGEQGERVSVLLLPSRPTSRNTSLIAFLLPIRLSSTMKTMSMPCSQQRLQLGDHLLARLDAGSAAEGDDDVAELALERAAARELEAAECIVPHLEQVEPRRRARSSCRSFRAARSDADGARCDHSRKKLRPGLLGLADEDRRRPSRRNSLPDGHPAVRRRP